MVLAIFTTKDDTPNGGNLIAVPDLYFTVTNWPSQISLEFPKHVIQLDQKHSEPNPGGERLKHLI